MDTKQPLSLFMVAILVASVFTVVGIASMPVRNVSAQAVSITTSADQHGGTFFGHGFLQVVINDPDADDDDTIETISVDIDATPSSGAGASGSFDIPETSASSGRFEFFLAHGGAVDVALADIDPINTAGIQEYDGAGNEAPVVRFGTGEELACACDLFEETSFDIQVGNEEISVDYEEDPVGVDLDREIFGTTSRVHIFILDQDANVNPTESDSFVVIAGNLTALFDVSGGSFAGDAVFNETGDNTARFEGIFQLNSTTDGIDNEFLFTDETVQLTILDQVYYTDVDDDINDITTDTADTTFEIDNEDGDMDTLSDLTFSGELKVTVRDDDQNEDSETEDEIPGGLRVVIGDGAGPFATGQDEETVDLTETDDNTGVFEIDLSNSELRLTFLRDGVNATANNGILEFRAVDIEEDILVEYIDPLADNPLDNGTAVVSVTLEMDLSAPQISGPEEVGVTDEVTITLNDNDLNNNPRTRDSYTILLDGDSPFALRQGSSVFSELYQFEMEVDGDPLSYSTSRTVTMTETGINTGIFEFEIDMEEDITDAADVQLSDGDEFEITVHDFFADVDDEDEDSVSITIGKANVGIDFDRTSPPIPPRPSSATADEVGSEVIVRMIIVDPTLATQSNVEEVIPFAFGTDPGEFELEIDGDDVENQIIDTQAEFDAAEIVDDVLLSEVLDIGDLEETGTNTGVFEVELTFSGNDDMDDGDWQDAEFTFTYVNDEEDEESGGFTFRGNDGIVTVDQPSAKAGTVLVITVEDQDLNLDTEEVETFDAQDELLFIETEDETIEDIAGCPAISDETFEETGEDTGVFTAQFEAGDEIPISCLDDDEVEVATNILITYNDEIDSAGGGGDELEINVPVVSSTGSIQVSPQLVGPSTELTVLIIDADLDEDARSTDEYNVPTADEDTDNFFVSFASSRNEVNEGSPDLEETGPNTGVFEFQLQLETDEEACQDDDLDGFEARGGSDPSIGACPGDLIAIRYEDSSTGSGGSATVSEVIEVMSWDPEFVADKDSYSVGDRVTVTISDPDANHDPDIADSLTDIRVTSDSDRVGEEFSAIETGRDTGVFRLTFGTSSGTAGGSITVKQGDDITIEYTDQYPADFVDEEEDKDFQFVISVGGTTGTGTTTVTPPELQDVTGQELDEVSAGQQVVLATSVRNNNDAPQPFVALIEVRDDSGVTVFLAWQTGTLPAKGQTQVGLSWTPDVAGDYQVRTFVISDLNDPQVLSLVSTSNITVN